jgi:S1-C subfamily serine protease
MRSLILLLALLPFTTIRPVSKALEAYTMLVVPFMNTDTGEEDLRHAAGVYFSPHCLLTAAHVYTAAMILAETDPEEQYADPHLFTDKGLKVEIQRVSINYDLELGVFRTSSPHLFAKIGKGVIVGEEVIMVGTPLGAISTVVFGRVSQMSPNRKEILIDATAMGGMSGAGVFNSKGEIVGIVSRAWGDSYGHMVVASSVYAIRQILKEKLCE